MQAKTIRFISALALFALVLLTATRFYEFDEPIWRFLTGRGRVDPLTLQLQGEFVEDNLGVEQAPDGLVTVRLIAEQFNFVPRCVIVPQGAPIRIRVTSADVVHMLSFAGTDYRLKAVPGAINEGQFVFSHPGIYPVPCHEFCGAGHYAMRSELRVVPPAEFPKLRPGERESCGPR